MATDARNAGRLPIVVTVVVALLLTILPLPGRIEAFRPDWVALTLVFWAMLLPRNWSIVYAWLIGLFIDVAQGTLLGQHALALSSVVFITLRFHLLMRVFPLSQLTLTVFALLTLYQFLLFWINGVAGFEAPLIRYWGPVLTGTLLWPIVFSFLSGVRFRMQLRH